MPGSGTTRLARTYSVCEITARSSERPLDNDYGCSNVLRVNGFLFSRRVGRVHMPEYATKDEVKAVDDRLTGIVDKLNEIHQNAKEYVDEANQAQDKAITDFEKKLVDSWDKSLQDHDKSIRKFISEEAQKVAKMFKKK
jgi:hypothetical protein